MSVLALNDGYTIEQVIRLVERYKDKLKNSDEFYYTYIKEYETTKKNPNVETKHKSAAYRLASILLGYIDYCGEDYIRSIDVLINPYFALFYNLYILLTEEYRYIFDSYYDYCIDNEFKFYKGRIDDYKSKTRKLNPKLAKEYTEYTRFLNNEVKEYVKNNFYEFAENINNFFDKNYSVDDNECSGENFIRSLLYSYVSNYKLVGNVFHQIRDSSYYTFDYSVLNDQATVMREFLSYLLPDIFFSLFFGNPFYQDLQSIATKKSYEEGEFFGEVTNYKAYFNIVQKYILRFNDRPVLLHYSSRQVGKTTTATIKYFHKILTSVGDIPYRVAFCAPIESQLKTFNKKIEEYKERFNNYEGVFPDKESLFKFKSTGKSEYTTRNICQQYSYEIQFYNLEKSAGDIIRGKTLHSLYIDELDFYGIKGNDIMIAAFPTINLVMEKYQRKLKNELKEGFNFTYPDDKDEVLLLKKMTPVIYCTTTLSMDLDKFPIAYNFLVVGNNLPNLASKKIVATVKFPFVMDIRKTKGLLTETALNNLNDRNYKLQLVHNDCVYPDKMENSFLDASKVRECYRKNYFMESRFNELIGLLRIKGKEKGHAVLNENYSYYIGIDWNGQEIGNHLILLEFDKSLKEYKVIDCQVFTSKNNTHFDDTYDYILKLKSDYGFPIKRLFVDSGYHSLSSSYLDLKTDKFFPSTHEKFYEENMRKIIFQESIELGNGVKTTRKEHMFSQLRRMINMGRLFLPNELSLSNVSEYTSEETILENQLTSISEKPLNTKDENRYSYVSITNYDHTVDALALSVYAGLDELKASEYSSDKKQIWSYSSPASVGAECGGSW